MGFAEASSALATWLTLQGGARVLPEDLLEDAARGADPDAALSGLARVMESAGTDRALLVDALEFVLVLAARTSAVLRYSTVFTAEAAWRLRGI